MQEQPSHWRKVWPQGVIDDSTNDADVLDMFNTPEDKRKKKVLPKETYPWTLSEDVKETFRSIKVSEGLTGKKLTADAVKQRGLNFINTYDNRQNVFERDLPYGPTWKDYGHKVIGH